MGLGTGMAILRALAVLVLLGGIGCTTQRTITITARPPDAFIKIDGVDRGKAPVIETFTFANEDETHTIVAQREGYFDAVWQLRRDFDGDTYRMELKPLTRQVTINVSPTPAIISINGKPVSNEMMTTYTNSLEFTKDARNEWTKYEVTAERPGYRAAKRVISYPDREPSYTLELQPLQKDIRVTTEPPGATVFLDQRDLGTAPVERTQVEFDIDPATNDLKPRRLRAVKAGFDPVAIPLAWDGGKTDYNISLLPKQKVVRITTNPPGVDLRIEGIEDFSATTNEQGLVPIRLIFPPVNEQGDLRTYKLLASKKPTDDKEWYPGELTVGWEDSRTEYTLDLKEILTRPTPLMTISPARGPNDWTVEAHRVDTMAMKDTAEGDARELRQIYAAAEGEFIDSLTISPDGSTLAFAIIPGEGSLPLRSQIRSVQANGSGGEQERTDGESLDLMPSFTPDGKEIYFASNRMSRKLTICSMATDGAGGIKEHTRGDSYDLWPSVDSDPRARLYYSRLMENGDTPRLYMQERQARDRTDLTVTRGGTFPRPNPQADAIVFASAGTRESTKRDLFRLAERGRPENLTNSPEVDEFDAVWSRDGSKLLFVSDRAEHPQTGRNRDIWLMDVTRKESPVQVTTNGSWDDSPVWDPAGNAVYFRSNRGGKWGIWRLSLR